MIKEGGRHALVVDAGRRLVQESEEPLSLKLTEEVLRLCAGAGRSIMGIRRVGFIGS